MMMMGEEVQKNYIYKLPIVRTSGCYVSNLREFALCRRMSSWLHCVLKWGLNGSARSLWAGLHPAASAVSLDRPLVGRELPGEGTLFSAFFRPKSVLSLPPKYFRKPPESGLDE